MENKNEAGESQAIETTDESLLKQLNERFGTSIASIDELKPKPPEETDQQKNEKLSAFEKNQIERFVAKETEGTYLEKVERFNNIKKLAEYNPEELTILNKKMELKKAGIADEDIEEEMKKRYYQYSDEEISEFDEEQQEQLKKAKSHYAEKLKNGSLYQIQAAKSVLEGIQKQIDTENYEAEIDGNISAKVAEIVKTMSRKVDIDLGMHNDVPISPIQFDMPDDVIQEVATLLSDPKERNKLLYNEDGSENVDVLFEALVWKKSAMAAVKSAYIKSADRQVQILQKTFPGAYTSIAPGSAGKRNNSGATGSVVPGSVRTERVVQKTN